MRLSGMVPEQLKKFLKQNKLNTNIPENFKFLTLITDFRVMIINVRVRLINSCKVIAHDIA